MDKNISDRRVLGHLISWKVLQEQEPEGTIQKKQRALITVIAFISVFLVIGITASPIHAQTYPSKPIRLILPFQAGGTTDTIGRILGQKLAETLGQPVIPENRGGSGGNIGYEMVAKARPDGYTIVVCGGSFTTSISLTKTLNYDPIRDFEPISEIAQAHHILLVNPSLPINNLKELIEYAKANPGKLNFGSGGIGTGPHLTVELLKSLAKIDIVHVPYKGGSQNMVGLIGGEVNMSVISPAMALPQIKAGKVRPLAVLGKERIQSLPNVPTTKEAGIDNWEATTWFGLLAPARTPRDIISRINTQWIRIAATTDTKEGFHKVGFEPMSSTPEKFSEFLKAETKRWAKVIKEANIRID